MLLKELIVPEAPAHNVIITKDWILVIPRTHSTVGNVMANAAVMVGMVWASKREHVDEWIREGPMNLLPKFGVPILAVEL